MTADFSLRRLNAADPEFARHLDHLLSWESVSDDAVNQRVLEIIANVRSRGDAALVEYSQRFDQVPATSMADLILPRERLELALERISPEQRQSHRYHLAFIQRFARAFFQRNTAEESVTWLKSACVRFKEHLVNNLDEYFRFPRAKTGPVDNSLFQLLIDCFFVPSSSLTRVRITVYYTHGVFSFFGYCHLTTDGLENTPLFCPFGANRSYG